MFKQKGKKRSLELITISIKFICWPLAYITYLVIVTIYDYYLAILVVFSFVLAVVSCRSKHRWKDICAFRVFPYKFQTSLQFFDLVDDYIQSEINKPPFRPTCTVLLLYEFLFNISFIMLTHLILPTHLKDKHALLFTLRLTYFIVFLFPSIKVP